MLRGARRRGASWLAARASDPRSRQRWHGAALWQRLRAAPGGGTRWPDLQALGFAVRTTVAALLALSSGILLGIERPYWAAMTVWLVAQPTRGLLLERSIARLFGTLVGAAVGFALIHTLADRPPLLILGLALWVGLCAGGASLLRHFRSYGLLLAGYTAGIIALLGFAKPELQSQLAWGRVWCTVIGVLASALVTGLFTPPARRDQLSAGLRRLARAAARHAALLLLGTEPQAVAAAERRLLAGIGELDAQTDQATAGSLAYHARARWGRHLLSAALTLVSEARALGAPPGGPAAAWRRRAAQALDEYSAALERQAAPPPLHFPDLDSAPPQIAAALVAMSQALRAAAVDESVAPDVSTFGTPASLFQHPDWHGALIASARTALALLSVAAVWLLTGWSSGPLMVMAANIFVTAFSSHEHPVRAVRTVFLAAVAGVSAGLICRLVLLPLAGNSAEVLLIIAPILALGAYAMARPSTAKFAIDFNMIFLLSAQPVLPLLGDAHTIVEQAAAIVCGAIASMLVFHLLMPVNPERRLDRVVERLTADLGLMARGAAMPDMRYRRARMIQRVIGVSATVGRNRPALAHDLLQMLALASLVGVLHAARQAPGGDSPAEPERAQALAALAARPAAWREHLAAIAALAVRG